MSVAPLSNQELGSFAAASIQSKAVDASGLFVLCRFLSSVVSAGNVGAFAETYRGEVIEQADENEIERHALDILAGRIDRGHWGPLWYNCISNCGKAFASAGAPVSTPEQEQAMLTFKALEEKVRLWCESEASRKQAREADAEAFNDVQKLPSRTCDEIANQCRREGMQRIIRAQFMVDESDGYTDYYGGRCARTVVIGFGKGKRENFKQLRKAAGVFPPTSWMESGIFTVRVIVAEAVRTSHQYYHAGNYSPHHERIGNGREFPTRKEAQKFIDSQQIPYSIFDGETEIKYTWDIDEMNIEHRENYSMGGGNYLGASRYSGWRIQSVPVDWFRGSEMVESFHI